MERIEITEEMLDRAAHMFCLVDGHDVDSSYSLRSKVWHILMAAIVYESEKDFMYSPSFP